MQPTLSLIHNSLGYLYLRQNWLDAAQKKFEEAAALDPTSYVFRFNLGVVRFRLGDGKAGTAFFQQALAMCRGQSFRDRLNRAWLEAIIGGKKRGLKELRQLLQSKQVSPHLLRSFMIDTEYLAQAPEPPRGVKEVLAELRRRTGNLQ